MASPPSIELLTWSLPKELFSRTVSEAPHPSPTSWLTSDRILLMNNMSAILAGIAGVLCLMVLAFTALIATNKESRKYLNRVSFRLLIYALISNCIYSIGYIICVKVNPGFWCVAGVWMIQFWLGVTNCLIMFIALNLFLVLVHLKNGIALEKWYLVGTICLNLATTLPPLIKGKYGWDPIIKVCWLTSNNDHNRLIWQFCTQLMWILLEVFITLLAATVTICSIYKHKFTAIKLLKSNQPTDTTMKSFSSHPPSAPMMTKKRRGSKYSIAQKANRSLLGNSDFRRIIWRISLYPIVMILINVVITAADIRISTANGIYNRYDYGLYVVYYALYGARGIFYAAIACCDPALHRGFRLWRGAHGYSSNSSDNLTDGAAAEANKVPDQFVEAKQRAQFGGINVQTQITTFIDNEDEVDPLDTSMPMTQIRNGPAAGAVHTVIGHGQQGPQITLPPAAMLSDHEELDGLNALPSNIAGNRLSKDKVRVQTRPELAGLEGDAESEFSLEELDDASTTHLTFVDAYGDVTSPPAQFSRADIEGIRQRQRQRSIARREAERKMKMQI